MIIWFLTLACLGIYNIIAEPMILKALNPYFIIYFIFDNGWAAFKALSGVFLVVPPSKLSTPELIRVFMS